MAKLVFILLCLHFVAIVDSRDATLTSGFGEDVVDAVIDKIQSSCIFSNDKYFLKRIAAVNTDFGKNTNTSEGGIWKIQQSMIDDVKYNCQLGLRSKCDAVYKSFNVDLNRMTLSDMEIPLKSALVMRALLSSEQSVIPATISLQAVLWKKVMSENDLTNFLNKANITSGCFSPKMDLIFAIDESGSVGRTNFQRTLTFLKDVVGGLKIGPNSVRTAVIEFASSATLSFPLNKYKNITDVVKAIASIRYTGGGTNTAGALNLVSKTFTRDRPNVLKILVLITDGRSNSFSMTADAASKLKKEKIIIFAIGIGNVRDSEMLNVSSDPSCIHFFKLSSYTEIYSIIHQIQRKACESSLEVDAEPDDTSLLNNTLPSGNEIQTKRITLVSNSSNTATNKNTTSIRVDVVCGVVHAFASSKIKNPNSAVFDFKTTASSGIPGWIHSQLKSNLYVSFFSKRSADVNKPGCTNPHYNISINPVKTSTAVFCTQNGIDRACTRDDVLAKFPDLVHNNQQCDSVTSIPNPCKKTNYRNKHPHPKYKNMYIDCTFAGLMKIVICPEGTNYNEQQYMCNTYVAPHPNVSKPYTGRNPCTTETTTRKQFYHANLNDIASFIQCNEQGDAFLVPCPKNTVWSQKAYTCVHKTIASYNPCNSSTNLYFYPYTKNKTMYIQCDSSDIAYVMACPPTTVWLQHNQTCIEDTKPVTTPVTQPCTDGQLYPFPGDKNFYYQCVHQKLMKRPCAGGTVWSQAKSGCDWPSGGASGTN